MTSLSLLTGRAFSTFFVGKNGTGKSNFFEALVEIFRHIFDSRTEQDQIAFSYEVTYEIDGNDTTIRFHDELFTINGREQKTVGQAPVPDNVLVYYSGHNPTINQTVSRYEKRFADQSKSWEADAARKFIGIRSDYKELLLSVLLMQEESCVARQYLCEKLQIDVVPKQAFELKLKRPLFASRVQVDVAVAESFLWGAAGTVRKFLDRLTDCIEGGFTFGSIYDRETDQYTIPIDLIRFQKAFAGVSASELFRSFDQLKAIDMFAGLSVPLRLINGDVAKVGDFSDGQFQSVYIFAISELFKDRNCITLLDEPDSFLHPEWQFGFLKQVVDITGTDAAETNHVLLSSHSASTIAKSEEPDIRMFEFGDNGVTVTLRDKSFVVKSLSAGLITLSEKEASLNIFELVDNSTGVVLFTEGPTDKLILDEAARRLFPGQDLGIEIVSTFGRQFLRTLFSSGELAERFGDRKMYALFDFDDAYADWFRLEASEMVQSDPHLCLTKRLRHKAHCALLLPVPACETLRRQALDADGNAIGTERACLSIEHLFCDAAAPGDHFKLRDVVGHGPVFDFVTKKVRFARDVVPTFKDDRFLCFKPVFDLVTEG